MTVKFIVLAEEIEGEIEQLSKVQNKIKNGLTIIHKNPEGKEYYVDSIAINLHSYYTGVENIFRSIASKVDGEVPKGERWHTDLLAQMTTPLKEVRPKVISDKTKEDLKKLLAFRHLIRNIYTFQLDEELVLKLANKLSLISKKLIDELKDLTEFLKTAGENSQAYH